MPTCPHQRKNVTEQNKNYTISMLPRHLSGCHKSNILNAVETGLGKKTKKKRGGDCLILLFLLLPTQKRGRGSTVLEAACDPLLSPPFCTANPKIILQLEEYTTYVLQWGSFFHCRLIGHDFSFSIFMA